MSEGKTVLIVGGIGIAAVAVLMFLKRTQANNAAYLNEPGLETQPGLGAVAQSSAAGAISQIIGSFGNSISSGISGLIGGAFSGQFGGSNEPGLEDDSDISYPGTDYSALSSQNAYVPGGSIFSGTDGTSVPDDFSQEENNFLDTGVSGFSGDIDDPESYATF
jgi:hypothetical protein